MAYINMYILALLYILSIIFVYKIAYKIALGFDSRSSVVKDRTIFMLRVRLAYFMQGYNAEKEVAIKHKERAEYFIEAFNDCFDNHELLLNRIADQAAHISRLDTHIESKNNLLEIAYRDINELRRQHGALNKVLGGNVKLTLIQETSDNERH